MSGEAVAGSLAAKGVGAITKTAAKVRARHESGGGRGEDGGGEARQGVQPGGAEANAAVLDDVSRQKENERLGGMQLAFADGQGSDSRAEAWQRSASAMRMAGKDDKPLTLRSNLYPHTKSSRMR